MPSGGYRKSMSMTSAQIAARRMNEAIARELEKARPPRSIATPNYNEDNIADAVYANAVDEREAMETRPKKRKAHMITEPVAEPTMRPDDLFPLREDEPMESNREKIKLNTFTVLENVKKTIHAKNTEIDALNDYIDKLEGKLSSNRRKRTKLRDEVWSLRHPVHFRDERNDPIAARSLSSRTNTPPDDESDPDAMAEERALELCQETHLVGCTKC